MNKLRIGVGVLILGVLVYFGTPTSATIRYRLTLTFTVDGVPVSGSGVIETTYTKVPDFYPDEHKMHATVRGETVMVDLGIHGKVIALLRPLTPDNDPGYQYLIPSLWGHLSMADNHDVNWIRGVGGVQKLPSEKIPILIHLRDSNDPKTIAFVNPDNAAEILVAGVQLSEAEVEITDSPITYGITKELPGLGSPEYTMGKISRNSRVKSKRAKARIRFSYHNPCNFGTLSKENDDE